MFTRPRDDVSATRFHWPATPVRTSLRPTVNASLAQGRLPASQLHAIVTPPLKKNKDWTVDVSDVELSARIEPQLHIEGDGTMDGTHCGDTAKRLPWSRWSFASLSVRLYQKRHSTEIAMLRVWSDILTAAAQRHVTLLGLLGYVRSVWLCRPRPSVIETTARVRLYRSCSQGPVLEWFAVFFRVVCNKSSTASSAVIPCSTRFR